MSEKPTVGRRLIGKPILWEDWDEAGEADDVEGSFIYWEQFSDLLMVGAVSAIADGLKEDPTIPGFVIFAVFYIIITRGWLVYNDHITSRFLDDSLLHNLILFFFLIGMAAQVINATVEAVTAFSLAVVLQRTAILVMLVRIGVFVERARAFAWVLGSITCLTIVLFGLAAVRPHYAIPLLCMAVVLDCSTDFILIYALPGNKLVPLKIEHSLDRLGALVVVMLGETMISSTITYRQYAAHAGEVSMKEYHTTLAGSFLLIFMFTLVYFRLQPRPQDHAFRRSRLLMTVLLLLNLTFGLCLLSVGVSIKLIVHAIAEQGKEPRFALGLSVGFSMLILFAMRICHYGGRLPRPHFPPHIRLLMWIWWAGMGIACLLPFGLMLVGTDHMFDLLEYSCLLLVLSVVGTAFKYLFEEYLESNDGEEKEDAGLLKTQGQTSYQSIDASA